MSVDNKEWIEIDSMFSENMGNGIEIDTGI